MATARFITAKGEYTLSPFAKEDWDSLMKYIKYRDYYSMKKDAETIPDLAPLLPEKLKECAARKVSYATIDKLLLNDMAFDVVEEFLYLSLRHYHKAITREEAGSLLTLANMQEALELIMDISGVPEAKQNPPTPAPAGDKS